MPTVAPLDLDGPCLAVAFLGDAPHFALAEGTVHWLDAGRKQAKLHDGLLCAALAPDGGALVTGGEDGKVMRLAAGVAAEIGSTPRKWVSAVAAGSNGAMAWAAGRDAVVRTADGVVKTFTHPRSVEGLAFAPKGLRLAVARYNGVTLHFPATDGKPAELEWTGAHTAVTFSPDGAYVVTAMQENALHGWRLADGRHMKMTGYPVKVKSLSWSARGRWLASSGAPAAIVWPFHGKDGPMGKAPLELGTRGDTMVTAVACHPVEEMVAIGYADGMVMAVRIADGREALLRRPGAGPVTALAWDGKGARLAFGSAAGDCGVIDITA
ncbi:MAG: WD40 repeat domain-containing protein [Phyllobacteriaceae bacterium]|nr:WD40 repeat domain-containing protein [Phyllobacteriaceae bacterium]